MSMEEPMIEDRLGLTYDRVVVEEDVVKDIELVLREGDTRDGLGSSFVRLSVTP